MCGPAAEDVAEHDPLVADEQLPAAGCTSRPYFCSISSANFGTIQHAADRVADASLSVLGAAYAVVPVELQRWADSAAGYSYSSVFMRAPNVLRLALLLQAHDAAGVFQLQGPVGRIDTCAPTQSNSPVP